MRILRVKVRVGAKKERFESTGENKFLAEVKEKAECNAANKRVRELVAAHLKVPLAAVRIRTGHRSPNKTIVVENEN